jgi:hypothetical protein
MRRAFLVAVSWGIVALAACARTPKDPATPLAVERIKSTIGLEWPYEVAHWASYRDLGSFGCELRGARGTRYFFGFRGGERISPEAWRTGSWRAPSPMYVGALYPRDPAAHPVPIGGPEEAAVRDVLLFYANREEPALRKAMAERGLTDSLIEHSGEDLGGIAQHYARVTGARRMAERLDRRVRFGAASDSAQIR